jgi:hypothetical protein
MSHPLESGFPAGRQAIQRVVLELACVASHVLGLGRMNCATFCTEYVSARALHAQLMKGQLELHCLELAHPQLAQLHLLEVLARHLQQDHLLQPLSHQVARSLLQLPLEWTPKVQ